MSSVFLHTHTHTHHTHTPHTQPHTHTHTHNTPTHTPHKTAYPAGLWGSRQCSAGIDAICAFMGHHFGGSKHLFVVYLHVKPPPRYSEVLESCSPPYQHPENTTPYPHMREHSSIANGTWPADHITHQHVRECARAHREDESQSQRDH